MPPHQTSGLSSLGATGTIEAPERGAVEPVAAVRPPALTRFQDMTAANVVALVGEPDFRRVELPAEVWHTAPSTASSTCSFTARATRSA